MTIDLHSLIRELECDDRIEAAFLFGSVASGKTRPGSDLDLAVHYAASVDRQALNRSQLELMGRLSLAAHADVHLCDLEAASPALVHVIVRDGKPLLDRNPTRTRALLLAGVEAHVDGDWARRALDERLAAQLASSNG